MTRHTNKLLILADAIERVPERKFHMGAWFRGPTDPETIRRPDHDCGSAACALGWCTAVFPDEWGVFAICDSGGMLMRPCLRHDPSGDAMASAVQFFGITKWDALNLFGPGAYYRSRFGGDSPSHVAAGLRAYVAEGRRRA